MKHVFNSAWRCTATTMPLLSRKSFQNLFLFCLCFTLVSTSCTKESRSTSDSEMAHMKNSKGLEERNVVQLYTGLSSQTIWELQQARAATAKYKNISNARKDGYVDIGVVAPNMGYHYMKEVLVDATFDVKSPEILVYNRDEKGNFYLVAVEYAVPLGLPRPQGFTGSHDVWDDASGFPLWLLHAWVWEYNPAGVFNPTNPLVHLH